MEMHFVPECYFDTVLVKNILRVKKVNHQHGCQSVIDEIETSRSLKDDFAVGIIDNDKKTLKYIKEECNEEIKTETLLLLKHKTKPHYIIQLIPAIESWILNVIQEGNVNVEDLNLPTELKKLTGLTKYRFVDENEELKRLCKRLVNSESKTMTTFSAWLRYLLEHNRNADIEALKAL